MKPPACPLTLLCAAFFAALFGASLPACGDGVGDPCGGSSGGTCAADQWCNFDNDLCGRDGTVGRCLPRPLDEDCDPFFNKKICGCDGRFYADECTTMLRGADLDASNSCPVEP
jgi:hypothetical protein